MAGIDLTRVRAYGDTLDDGWMQLSFTLPIAMGERAKHAASELASKMGFEDVGVTAMHAIDPQFTFFVIYGRCRHTVDVTAIEVVEAQLERMDYYEINRYIEEKIGRKLVVVGACTGSDAHTVGIDAILNMKGYSGEYGLERYPQFEVYNLGSQVVNEDLVAQAIELKADTILVSQIVTQKNVHIENLTELADLIEAEGLRDRVLLIVGGPRISHRLAIELGYDAGFGPGTLPPDVGSFIATEVVRRNLQ
ncbi:cobalamin-dependent protein [Candidatus Bipolaricaulota bacterium]|nr:cobalamin-dependent protein [Candidatus Bipolaricaulota bacterium]